MSSVSPSDRAAAYAVAFPHYPASHLTTSGRWLYGTWILGNYYVGSGYYGAYPPGYLKRILALFPEARRVLHLFSGSLQRQSQHTTLDCQITDTVRPRVCGSALHPPFLPGTFDLGLADPPYSPADAARYGTPMVHRQAVIRAAAGVIRPGGHLVWLDTQLPMFSKREWHWWGAITLIRSTNHRVRLVSLFERTV